MSAGTGLWLLRAMEGLWLLTVGLVPLAFAPQDGVEVIATGKLTTYPGRSKYQIVIERMELAGEGALLALLIICTYFPGISLALVNLVY